jgi:predicted secreted Zn-dependent protease
LSPLFLIAGLLLADPQSAPETAGGGEGARPATASALAAAAPELAALPGVALVGYPVRGRSPRAIRESINEGRPKPEEGDAFDARTVWRYQTRWLNDAAGVCDPTTVEVEMTIIVTLPELATRDALDRREREQWDHYLTALIAHEHNHVRVALAGAEQLRTFMRSAPDCTTMEAVQRQIGASIQAANDAYDETTRHGRTEGAVYP